MKYVLLTLAVIFFVFSAVKFFIKGNNRQELTPAEDTTSVRMKFSKLLIDVGDQKVKTSVKARYVLYNIGKADLYIQNVLPDCHCTVANFSEKPIKPTDSAIITLSYDSTLIGPFQSSAVVSTNTTNTTSILIFRGVVIQ